MHFSFFRSPISFYLLTIGVERYFWHVITLNDTLGRTPLYEGSACPRDLYLTTYNTHNRQTSILPAGFEATIPATERPQTHAVDRAATGICCNMFWGSLKD